MRTLKEIFIEKAFNLHGVKYNYNEIVYVNNRTKIKIFCNKCNNNFEQFPTNHLKGHGCSFCGGSKISNTLDFIMKSREKHQNLFSYNKTNYSRAKEKVTITCPIHGDFEQTPNNHLSGKGCETCSLETRGGYRKKRFFKEN